jgi:hypothetical protein
LSKAGNAEKADHRLEGAKQSHGERIERAGEYVGVPAITAKIKMAILAEQSL